MIEGTNVICDDTKCWQIEDTEDSDIYWGNTTDRIDEPNIYANATDTDKVMWKDDDPALSAITNTTEQKTLDDLVEIKDNEIILKYSIKIPVAGLGEISLPKGAVIKIEE